MNDEETRRRETKDNELTVPFNQANLPPAQEFGAPIRVAVKHTRFAKFSIQDFASGNGLQTADHGLYFG